MLNPGDSFGDYTVEKILGKGGMGVVYQIASALELTREKGIVHRDIKPGNIMFDADGMAKAVSGEPIPDVRKMRSEVSVTVAELISLMCAIKVDERVQTPAEVTTVLSLIAHGHEVTISSKRPSAAVKKHKGTRGDLSRKVIAAVFGLAMAAGLGAFVYCGWRTNRTAVPPRWSRRPTWSRRSWRRSSSVLMLSPMLSGTQKRIH